MKLKIAAIGSFAPAGAAVAGSVALSLLVLHAPPAGLLPGTAPADRGHIESLVLPAPYVSRTHATTQIDVPRPTPSAITEVTPRHEVTRPATPPSGPTPQPSPPPVVTVPTPVPQPVTTPVTTPPVSQPTVTPPPPVTPSNHGRWSSPQTKVWRGRAAKQALRVEKGKPPWAGPKKSPPPPPTTTTITTTTTTVPADVSDTTPTTPPGQAKTPPGQAKTPPGQEKKAKSPHG